TGVPECCEVAWRAWFVPFGTVQSCSLVLDKDTGISKGFGFIEMPKIGEAKTAMKNLNGKEVGSSKIRVKKAEQKVTASKSDVAGSDE
ncbi:hypothetical protein BMR02_13460, partial [Methylococcaceae bacterium HT1]